MGIVLNFASTFSLILFIMVLFDQICEDHKDLRLITESSTYKAVGGAVVVLTAAFWFIFFLCLIWS